MFNVRRFCGSVLLPPRVSRARRWMLAVALLSFALPVRPASDPGGAEGDKPSDAGGRASPSKPAESSDHELIEQLLAQIEELNARVVELESRGADKPAEGSVAASGAASPRALAFLAVPPLGGVSPASAAPETPAPTATASANASPPPEPQDGHDMSLAGGPSLNIRGFLDFNFDAGRVANPLIYPLTLPPPNTVHDAFQFGEFDLFLNSRLSSRINFLSEVVFGSDASNFWGIDIERAQITYKPSQYFQISGGRMHTAIGYYNTAYHHGAWFQIATGRPYMYYYEDAGGILPVHIVGLEATGLIPGSGKLNAHWIAEIGNGESSSFIGQPIVSQPVQNFASDTDHKAFNLAGYVKFSSLQIGGNYYNTIRVPDGIPHVNNTITGAYVVFSNPAWEFFNELQVQRDHLFGSPVTYNTPLGYTQISHKFGKYRPYFRWQEVNVPANDPLYGTVGRYEGPSPGLRMDFADYAALKVQYNRIYTRNPRL